MFLFIYYVRSGLAELTGPVSHSASTDSFWWEILLRTWAELVLHSADCMH